MARHLTSAIDLFGKSYDIVSRNLKIFALLYSASAVTIIVSIIDHVHNAGHDRASWKGVISNTTIGGGLHTSFYGTGGLLLLALTVVSVIFGLLTTILCLRTSEGKKPGFDELWSEFTSGWLWAKLLFLLITMALAIGIGFILLIVPGVILLWRLIFAPYILIDRRVEISEAFVHSWEMTKGHAWAIYSILLVSLALGLPAVVPVIGPIIGLVLGIAYSVAPALRYQELRARVVHKS